MTGDVSRVREILAKADAHLAQVKQAQQVADLILKTPYRRERTFTLGAPLYTDSYRLEVEAVQIEVPHWLLQEVATLCQDLVKEHLSAAGDLENQVTVIEYTDTVDLPEPDDEYLE